MSPQATRRLYPDTGANFDPLKSTGKYLLDCLDTPLMDTQPQPAPSKQDLVDLASEQLKVVSQKLKAVRKVLARDWEGLSPRERSVLSRQVKDLERQQQALRDEIEVNSSA